MICFEEMFEDVYGYKPFPWQSNIAKRLTEGDWMTSVDVPTASGKTALIDACVFAAAHGGPRRIAFIIDRRVVVDEAYERAQKLKAAIQNHASLQTLKDQLGDIQVIRLRGGVHGYDDWVLFPDRLTIIISTVDQVGSRLLHRGYGVSSRMAPVHAGFLGNDAVYIVDEAHLSHPFMETVSSACEYGADIRLVSMTATPLSKSSNNVKLSSSDRSHPVLKKRLCASKRISLEVVSNTEADFVKRAVEVSQGFMESANIIGVIVNRVNTARRIHKALRKKRQKSELLTGRIRPYDRDQLMNRLMPRIKSGRNRNESIGDPLFIVSTQTVEVGADIDFDAIVSEAAPLDSLKQRFGRLDRLGELGETRGAILYRPKLDNKKKPIPDPIYGDNINLDWLWLLENAKDNLIDFGIQTLESLVEKCPPPRHEVVTGPPLLPTHVQLLAQTGYASPYVDVSPWLHGVKTNSADVSLVWRSDIQYTNMNDWLEIIKLRPPLMREAMEIPVYAVRSWLEGKKEQEITDLEGIDVSSGSPGRSDLRVIRWRGPDDVEVVGTQNIRPGDTIVLCSEYGGCNKYGWDPGEKKSVEDVADYCSLERARNHMVRLVPGLTKWLEAAIEEQLFNAAEELVEALNDVDPEEGIDQERIQKAKSSLKDTIEQIDNPLLEPIKSNFSIELHPAGGVILTGRVLNDTDTALNVGKKVELDVHMGGVASKAARLSEGHPLKNSIIQAAENHDLGKSDPRFQSMLYGDPILASSGPPLAKSGMRSSSQMLASYNASGLPKGFRHELASVVLLEEAGIETPEELVKYLVATHHGFGRPWFPVVRDESDTGIQMASARTFQINRYAELQERYGPWKLAGLELLIRAADARESIMERTKR